MDLSGTSDAFLEKNLFVEKEALYLSLPQDPRIKGHTSHDGDVLISYFIKDIYMTNFGCTCIQGILILNMLLNQTLYALVYSIQVFLCLAGTGVLMIAHIVWMSFHRDYLATRTKAKTKLIPGTLTRLMSSGSGEPTRLMSSGSLHSLSLDDVWPVTTVNSTLNEIASLQKVRHLGDYDPEESGKFTIILDLARNILLFSAFLDLTNRSEPVVQLMSLIELKPYTENDDCFCVIYGSYYGKMRTHTSHFTQGLAGIGPATLLRVEGDSISRRYSKRVVPCHFPERFLSWRDLRVGLKCGGKSDVRLPANSTVKVETPVFIPDEERMEFGVCVSVVYKHLDPYRLVEWLEMQRILGVGKIFIYNSSIGFQESRVLWDYQDEGFVEVHQIPPIQGIIDGQNESIAERRARQVIGLNDCMFRNMFQFKYMCGLDTDEFIMPQITSNLSSLLRRIYQEQPHRMTSHQMTSHRMTSTSVGLYTFQTVNFLSEPGYDPRPDLSKPWYTHYLRYRWGLPVRRFSTHPKVIFNPRVCKALFVHRCAKLDSTYREVRVDITTGFLSHHKDRYCVGKAIREDLCSSPHLRTLYDGVLKYETLLVKSVNDKLHHLGLSTDTQPVG